MNAFDLLLAFAAGLAAGSAYFMALWLTIRWFTQRTASPSWLLASAAIRLALLIGVLLWIMDGQIEKLFAALAGFLLVRFVALRRGRAAGRQEPNMTAIPAGSEASDATDAR